MKEKWTLENLQLKRDTHIRAFPYYLEATYLVENDKTIDRVVLPHIVLPICPDNVPIIGYNNDERSVHFNSDSPFMLNTVKTDLYEVPVYYYRVTVSHKVKEMTLEEIEEKLGHKVKIVNKKEG